MRFQNAEILILAVYVIFISHKHQKNPKPKIKPQKTYVKKNQLISQYQ